MRRLIVGLALAAALVPFAASADGEAGLVIQVGDQVTTYCVPFTGDSIGGVELLAASGLPVEQFGGAGGRVVCAIGEVGCFDPSSFESCFCQCRGPDCTYWAFFTRAYGRNWVFSSLGIVLARAKDGDVHGWKWGRGGPSSAPADLSFEQICGHPPRGGAAPAATPVPATPVPATPVPTPAATPGPVTPATTPAATPATTPAATAVITLVPVASPTIVAVAPVDAPAAGGADGDDGVRGRLLGFGAVAGVLAVAIAAATVWRLRRGR
jgi:hypothetical protein